MHLTSGDKLGSYEIISPLGVGGMGEVYRARDTKLGREVAIKVLPEAFSEDKERLARFEREARLLASLNHPNVAAIYGLETSESLQYLVLELVEGETLQEHIAKGTVSIYEALPLFQQIAQALEAAHDKGIIHRDLKPANIKITLDDKVKVLDFGLAKSYEAETSEEVDLSQSPTITRHATQAGVILGTASYMSPEQARGKVVDKRADIWAFGCVLFEALTGRQAFPGDTLSDVLATVLAREPELDKLPETTPSSIRALLRRCLRKEPEKRLRDIGDARLEIEDALNGGIDDVSVPVAAKPQTGWRRTMPWLLAGLMAVLAIGVYTQFPALVTPQIVRTSVIIPGLERGMFDVSPDGTKVVYAPGKNRDEERRLHVRRLDEDESTPIPGTEMASSPFFSPDDKWIGFFHQGVQLKKVPLDGVGAVTLTTKSFQFGGDWGPDDSLVFQLDEDGRLARISADGGDPEVLTTLDKENGELWHCWPHVLPNGKALVYTAHAGGTDSRIMIQSLSSEERRFLAEGSDARYVSTGHLVFGRGETLFAAPFDLDRLELTGNPVPVQTGVMKAAGAEMPFSVADDGTLFYVPAPNRDSKLILVDLQGRAEPLAAPPLPYNNVRFSPDGKSLAIVAGRGDVHLYELEQERFSLLFSSFEDGSGKVWTTGNIEWSPDGTRFAVGARRSGSGTTQQLFVVPIDGKGNIDSVVPPVDLKLQIAESWSPDGKRILYHEYSGKDTNAFVVTLDPRSEPQPLNIDQEANAQSFVFSPDGLHIAYASLMSGKSEVYVQRYDGSGAGRQVSTDGGSAPVWAPDGRTLCYRNGSKMMAVEITTTPMLTAGKPRLLFERDFERRGLRSYDLAPDGQKFVMIQSENRTALHEIRVVQNWFEELKRLAPIE